MPAQELTISKKTFSEKIFREYISREGPEGENKSCRDLPPTPGEIFSITKAVSQRQRSHSGIHPRSQGQFWTSKTNGSFSHQLLLLVLRLETQHDYRSSPRNGLARGMKAQATGPPSLAHPAFAKQFHNRTSLLTAHCAQKTSIYQDQHISNTRKER